jgi:hypothetical protein
VQQTIDISKKDHLLAMRDCPTFGVRKGQRFSITLATNTHRGLTNLENVGHYVRIPVGLLDAFMELNEADKTPAWVLPDAPSLRDIATQMHAYGRELGGIFMLSVSEANGTIRLEGGWGYHPLDNYSDKHKKMCAFLTELCKREGYDPVTLDHIGSRYWIKRIGVK